MLLIDSYLPITIGGKEIVVHQLAKSYQALGHEVSVEGPGHWRTYRKLKFEYPLHRWPPIPFVSKDFSKIIHLIWAIKRFKPDVIHAHSTYFAGYVAAHVKKILKFPLIVTPHGGDIHAFPEINVGMRLDPVLDKKIRYALRIADYITVISDSVKNSALEAGGAENKMIAIYNGVDLDRFQRKHEINIYDYLGFSHDSLLVTTVGNYRPLKGHEILVESIKIAIKQEPRIKLVVVGKTSPELMAVVESEGLAPFIKFTGSLDFPIAGQNEKDDVLAAILAESKIYVSSSIGEGAEGMSLALLEAMSAGACQVVTDISGNRDLIVNGENGLLVPPSSPDALANAIVKVLHDEDLYAALKARSLETAEQFGWLKIAEQYIELYKDAINRIN